MRCILFMAVAAVLLSTGCAPVGRRVVVEPGPSWLRPWQRPYTVDGRRFVPLQKADGFREEGLASWYGREEHGGPTSNGETFDVYQLTAAHKVLPLGSRVRVISKVNGRQVVVRVNDRGPFVEGRIVDLSYQAARQLDMLGAGVAPVSLEVVPGGGQTAAVGADAPPGGSYALQVAACTDRQTARKIAERLVELRLSAIVLEASSGDGSLFRVRAGGLRSRSEAEALRRFLAENGYADAFIVDR